MFTLEDDIYLVEHVIGIVDYGTHVTFGTYSNRG